jgi:FlaG/FlaF family flagellin (archaellin)
MDNRWTKWQEDIRAASTIIAVLLLVSVVAAVCVRLLLGI